MRYRRPVLTLDRAPLNHAFRLMRAKGLIARQNYLCCGGCAGAQIANGLEQLATVETDYDGSSRVAGAVFYHRQTADRLKATGQGLLYYGPVDAQSIGEVGRPAGEVGVLVTAALAEAGVSFRWDGDPDKAIEFWLEEAR